MELKGPENLSCLIQYAGDKKEGWNVNFIIVYDKILP